MPKKFWQFRNQAAGSAELLLYGDISDSSWWGDEVTPKTFADELNADHWQRHSSGNADHTGHYYRDYDHWQRGCARTAGRV